MVLGRESLARPTKFPSCNHPKVQLQDIRKAHEIEQDIGDLVARTCAERLSRRQANRLVRGQPLKELRKFTDLTDQREDQRLRVVELRPIALLGEFPHPVPEVNEVRHAVSIPRESSVGRVAPIWSTRMRPDGLPRQ